MAEVPPQLQKYVFKKGWKGGGRKKGKTLKEYSREYLAKMTDEERIAYLNSLSPGEVWRMAEGNPHSTEDITTGGKSFPPPIYAGISRHNNNKKDIRPKKEDKSN